MKHAAVVGGAVLIPQTCSTVPTPFHLWTAILANPSDHGGRLAPAGLPATTLWVRRWAVGGLLKSKRDHYAVAQGCSRWPEVGARSHTRCTAVSTDPAQACGSPSRFPLKNPTGQKGNRPPEAFSQDCGTDWSLPPTFLCVRPVIHRKHLFLTPPAPGPPEYRGGSRGSAAGSRALMCCENRTRTPTASSNRSTNGGVRLGIPNDCMKQHGKNRLISLECNHFNQINVQ